MDKGKLYKTLGMVSFLFLVLCLAFVLFSTKKSSEEIATNQYGSNSVTIESIDKAIANAGDNKSRSDLLELKASELSENSNEEKIALISEAIALYPTMGLYYEKHKLEVDLSRENEALLTIEEALAILDNRRDAQNEYDDGWRDLFMSIKNQSTGEEEDVSDG